MADRTSTVRVNVITDASGAAGLLGKFGKVAAVAATSVGAVAVGGAIAADKLYSFGDAVDDANTSIAQGIRTMKLFGQHAGEVTARVQAQAEALSKQTAVDQVVIKNTQAKLLTFKELAKTADQAGGNFDRATQAAIDLAAKGFGTAETNAVQLGKALNDPVKGLTSLSRAGITFTDQEKERIKTLVESNKMGQAQALVLKSIESQVGGTAAATAGGFELMKNRIKLFGQELAQRALPYLDRFGNFMVETGGPAMLRFGRVASERVLPALRRVGVFVRDQVLPALQTFAGWVNEHLVPLLEQYLGKALDRARSAFNDVRQAVKRNQPELEDMWAKFKKVATFIVDKVGPIVADLATAGLPVLGKAISTAITWISAMWSAWSSVWDIVKKVADAISGVIGKLKDLADTPGVGALAGLLRTSGGGQSAADQTNQLRLGGGGLQINFNGPVTDPRGTADAVERVIRRNHVSIGVPVGA